MIFTEFIHYMAAICHILVSAKMELVSQTLIFATVATFIATASGQCPPGCFCLAGYVTCSRLTSFPRSFPEDTRAIIINNMELDEIPSGIFNKLPALETIEIYLGTVGKIATGAFDSLTYLDSISLNELRIGVIESYAFHNITDIGTISIYMSEIETIESYAFWDIFALDEIKLFMLNVTNIESLAISNVDELFHFSFYTNNIHSLKPYAFTNITNVHKMSLYLNHFGDMGCGSIEALLEEAYEHSLYSNSVTCSCDLVWIHEDPVLENHLFSNWCQVPNTDEKIYWEDISSAILECSIEEISECPPISLFEFTQATDAIEPVSANYLPFNTVPVSHVASITRETVTTAPQSSSISTDESLTSSKTAAMSSPSVTSESLSSSETTVSSSSSLTSEDVFIPYVSLLPTSPSDATENTKVPTVSMSGPILRMETAGLPGPMPSNSPTLQKVNHTSIATSTAKPDSSAPPLQSTAKVTTILKDVITRSTKSSSYNFHQKVVISNETMSIHAVTVRETDSSTVRKNPPNISIPKGDRYISSAAHVNVYRIGVIVAFSFSVMCTSVNVKL